MGEAKILLLLNQNFSQLRARFLKQFINFILTSTLTLYIAIMPTIVTELVNDMFRSRKRDFVKKLRDMPVASTDSEGEDSDAETLDSTLDTSSADLSQLAANQPREEFFLWGTELSRSRDQQVLKLDEDINEDEQRHLIASLTLGKKDCANLDLCLAWTKNKEIKFKLVMGSGPITISGNHHVEYLTLPEDIDDPDFIAEETATDDETELSTFEDPEELEENELKELAEESTKPLNGASNGDDPKDGKRKRAASPDEPSMKKRKASDDVNVKEVDLKA